MLKVFFTAFVKEKIGDVVLGKDLTEAKDIKNRWQEHTAELYKKGLNDPDNHGSLT